MKKDYDYVISESSQEYEIDFDYFKSSRDKNPSAAETDMLNMYKSVTETEEVFERGDDKCNEPDFVNSNKCFGVEMTFIETHDSNSYIKQLKDITHTKSNAKIEYNDISKMLKKSVDKKAKNKESGNYKAVKKIDLVVLFPMKVSSTDLKLLCHNKSWNKTCMDLKKKYINNSYFNNIYVFFRTIEGAVEYCEIIDFGYKDSSNKELVPLFEIVR